MAEVFDHITHMMYAVSKDLPEGMERWCGGTIPPSLIEVDRDHKELTVSVYDNDADVHSPHMNDEPICVEEIDVGPNEEFDAYTISRAAVRTVRKILGLNPDDKATKDPF